LSPARRGLRPRHRDRHLAGTGGGGRLSLSAGLAQSANTPWLWQSRCGLQAGIVVNRAPVPRPTRCRSLLWMMIRAKLSDCWESWDPDGFRTDSRPAGFPLPPCASATTVSIARHHGVWRKAGEMVEGGDLALAGDSDSGKKGSSSAPSSAT
jgi:hypothetical protein